MLKYLLSVFIITTTLQISAQSEFTTQLDSIKDEAQAFEFINNFKNNKGKLITFNKEKHKTELAKDLFKIGKGGTKTFKTDIEATHYKIVEHYEIPYYRVSYVFLDDSKISTTEIKKVREKIINRYNAGISFHDLAKTYSMDQNANRGGDLGWFTSGEMVPEFESLVIGSGHLKNEAFTVDIPERGWYYVVIKTYDTKLIDEIKVLKVTEAIN